jgi:hypothetical protein
MRTSKSALQPTKPRVLVLTTPEECCGMYQQAFVHVEPTHDRQGCIQWFAARPIECIIVSTLTQNCLFIIISFNCAYFRLEHANFHVYVKIIGYLSPFRGYSLPKELPECAVDTKPAPFVNKAAQMHLPDKIPALEDKLFQPIWDAASLLVRTQTYQ